MSSNFLATLMRSEKIVSGAEVISALQDNLQQPQAIAVQLKHSSGYTDKAGVGNSRPQGPVLDITLDQHT